MASQEARDALFIASDYRANFKNIIAKRLDQCIFNGGRMKYAASGYVTYNAGLVLGYATSGADAGFFKPYNSANVDGSQVAVGILTDEVTTDAQGNGSTAKILVRGVVYQAALIGLDAGAITNLQAKSFVELGQTLLSIYA